MDSDKNFDESINAQFQTVYKWSMTSRCSPIPALTCHACMVIQKLQMSPLVIFKAKRVPSLRRSRILQTRKQQVQSTQEMSNFKSSGIVRTHPMTLLTGSWFELRRSTGKKSM